MKKLLFILLFSLSTTGFAQTEKKSWLIGGSATASFPFKNNSNNSIHLTILLE